MHYAWIIDKDLIAEAVDEPAVGTIGPRNVDTKLIALLKANAGTALPFRMLDDDGEVYYEGRLIGTDFDQFEPLDDFGTPYAGCTTIEYKNPQTGAWEIL